MSQDEESDILKEYLGIVWIDDQPGQRFSLWAKKPLEALALAKSRFGDHPMTVWNEEDAHKLR